MVGIIGAMASEIDEIKRSLKETETQKISKIEFAIGKLNGIECVVAVSGVGKAHAAMCTEAMIIKFSPELIINIGVAGGIDERLKISDTVIADFVMQHDMDTSEIGDPKGMISGINMIEIPCDQNLIKSAEIAAKTANLTYYTGTIMSGDQFISRRDKLNDLREQFNGIACDMESGAIGQVCYLNMVKFLCVRSISDNANSESKMDYEKFLSLAVEKTHKFLFKFLRLNLE